MKENASMICPYWNVGNGILQKQREEGWGAKVIDRISQDIKDVFPEMKGFSPRNKIYRKLADSWRNFEIVQQPVPME